MRLKIVCLSGTTEKNCNLEFKITGDYVIPVLPGIFFYVIFSELLKLGETLRILLKTCQLSFDFPPLNILTCLLSLYALLQDHLYLLFFSQSLYFFLSQPFFSKILVLYSSTLFYYYPFPLLSSNSLPLQQLFFITLFRFLLKLCILASNRRVYFM